MPTKTLVGLACTLLLSLASCTQDLNSQFMEAVENGETESIQALLKAGADVDLQNEEGWSAIIAMAMLGQTRTVQLLLDAGAEVNATE